MSLLDDSTSRAMLRKSCLPFLHLDNQTWFLSQPSSSYPQLDTCIRQGISLSLAWTFLLVDGQINILTDNTVVLPNGVFYVKKLSKPILLTVLSIVLVFICAHKAALG